jgi:hypothetical protein
MEIEFRIGGDPADAANTLVACIIVAFLVSGMCGKLGQIVVHDILTSESVVCRCGRYERSRWDSADPGGAAVHKDGMGA